MEKVKDLFKRGVGFFIIFFLCTIVYSIVHEIGHILFALVVGEEIYNFNLILGSVTVKPSALPYERIISLSGGVIMTFMFTLLFGFLWWHLIHKEKRNRYLHVYFLMQITIFWSDFSGQMLNYLLKRKTSDFYKIAQIDPNIITGFLIFMILDIFIYLFIMLKGFSDLYFFLQNDLRKIVLLIK